MAIRNRPLDQCNKIGVHYLCNAVFSSWPAEEDEDCDLVGTACNLFVTATTGRQVTAMKKSRARPGGVKDMIPWTIRYWMTAEFCIPRRHDLMRAHEHSPFLALLVSSQTLAREPDSGGFVFFLQVDDVSQLLSLWRLDLIDCPYSCCAIYSEAVLCHQQTRTAIIMLTDCVSKWNWNFGTVISHNEPPYRSIPAQQ